APATPPGPPGRPGAARGGAKCAMFSASRPLASPPPPAGEDDPAKPGPEGACPLFMRQIHAPALLPLAPSLPSPARGGGRKLLRRSQLRLHLVQKLLDLRAFELGDVVLVFEQHTERVGDGRRIERDHVEF